MIQNARILRVGCDDPVNSSRLFADTSAFAHPWCDGAVLRSGHTETDGWHELDFDWSEHDSKTLQICRFELKSQIDERTVEPYAVRLGYRVDGCIMTSSDVVNRGKAVGRLERGLSKLTEQHGRSASFGVLILRFAMVLKADYVIQMRSRPWNYDDKAVHLVHSMNNKPAECIWYIDEMIRKSHEKCKKLCGIETVSA